jgi:hypothetical protein
MGTSDPSNNSDAGLQLAIRADAFVTGQQTHLPIECRKKHVNANIAVAVSSTDASLPSTWPANNAGALLH